MTIDEAYRLLAYIANKNQRGEFSPDDFNLMAPVAQMSVINDRLGNLKKYRPNDPVPAYGFGISQKSIEELRPIIKPFVSLSVTSNKSTYPTDCIYIHHIAISNRTARPVMIDEWQLMNFDSVIKAPSTEFPVYVVMNDGIYTYPTASGSISCTYVRRPAKPVWNYTVVNDRPVYNATGSQDFELADTVHFEICMRILSYIGVNLDKDALIQYAELQEQKGS